MFTIRCCFMISIVTKDVLLEFLSLKNEKWITNFLVNSNFTWTWHLCEHNIWFYRFEWHSHSATSVYVEIRALILSVALLPIYGLDHCNALDSEIQCVRLQNPHWDRAIRSKMTFLPISWDIRHRNELWIHRLFCISRILIVHSANQSISPSISGQIISFLA